MSYEMFRTALHTRLTDRLPVELLHDVLQELDIIAQQYDIKRSCTDLITYGGMPEVVKMYIASMAVRRCAKDTLKNYHGILTTFFNAIRKPFNTVTTNDVRVFMFQLQQDRNLEKSSLEHYRVVINAFYQWCVNEELLERNPARKITPIKVPESAREPIDMVELEYLRKCCETPRQKALVDFLYSTGCRVSECAAVQMTDIDWKERAVKIRHGKGDKFRIVYFNPESEVSLKEYIKSKPHETQYLFSKTRAPYGKITRNALEEEVRKIRMKAGDHLSTNVTPHVLRHTFATTAIHNGMPIEQVQQLLGHTSLDTTRIYAKSNQDDIKASHRKYLS